MGIKVYYSEISAHKEVKKRQQKVMMILESKTIPYEAIDITEAGRESDKDFMLTTAKPRGDSKCVLSPQIFNEENYCGDYDDFELANENDELEKFLNIDKIISNSALRTNGNSNGIVNGNSRESSAEFEKPTPQPEIQPIPTDESAATVPKEEAVDSTITEVLASDLEPLAKETEEVEIVAEEEENE